MIIDEFSALGSENVVNLMELVRDLGGIVILAAQTTAALGDERLQQRILGNVTIYLQRMNDPREVAILGGLQQRLDVSLRIGEVDKGQGMARYVDKAVIDPTRVAQLPTGGAFLINRGYAAQVKILQSPPVDWSQVEPETTLLMGRIQGLLPAATPTAAPPAREPTFEPGELWADVSKIVAESAPPSPPLCDDDFI